MKRAWTSPVSVYLDGLTESFPTFWEIKKLHVPLKLCKLRKLKTHKQSCRFLFISSKTDKYWSFLTTSLFLIVNDIYLFHTDAFLFCQLNILVSVCHIYRIKFLFRCFYSTFHTDIFIFLKYFCIILLHLSWILFQELLYFISLRLYWFCSWFIIFQIFGRIYIYFCDIYLNNTTIKFLVFSFIYFRIYCTYWQFIPNQHIFAVIVLTFSHLMNII